MRKRFEEELAQLAFGDLSSDRAAELRARADADPDAAQTFDTYCRMKEELRSLAVDVPAEQLSTERLRDAILKRGLTEKPMARTRPTWLWVPVAAGIFAFGIAFIKGNLPTPVAPTAVVMNDTFNNSNEDLLPNMGVEVPIPPATARIPETGRVTVASSRPATQVAANERSAVRTKRSTYESVSRSTDEVVVPEEFTAISFERTPDERAQALTSTTFDFGGEEAAVASVAAPQPVSQPNIILIQSDTDAQTGALRATEVENTSNVVVGG